MRRKGKGARIARAVVESLVAVLVAMPIGACGHYFIARQLQYGRVTGFQNDTEGGSYVMAFALSALPALLLSIAAVRGMLFERALTVIQRSVIGVVTGAMMCLALFGLYAPVVFAGGPGFVWPLPLIMGGVAGLVTALLRRPRPAGGRGAYHKPS